MKDCILNFRWLFFILIASCFHSEANTLLLTTDDGPPHIIKETHGGIDIEITKSVLALMGYRADVMYAPLSRGLLLVEKGKADLTVPTFFQQDNDSLFFSKALF